MSKDFKDIINTVEEETKTHAELEAIINSLKEEINRLTAIVKEQKMLINEESDSTILGASTNPGEVDILKNLVISQRQKLNDKDETNEKLQDKIDELKLKIMSSQDGTFTTQENEDLIAAQELILAFTEENEDLKNQLAELKNPINSTNLETSKIKATNQELLDENEEMVNIKRLNFQLMEENGLLRVEVESLKVKLQEQIEEVNSEEMQLAYQKIETLTIELDDYEAQVRYLQQKLEEDVIAPVSLNYTTDEFNNLKEELSRSQDETQKLTNILLEMDHSTRSQLSEKDSNSVVFNFPKQFQISLFKRMYNLLNDIDKKAIIDILIKDLANKNNDVKRAALKILCEMREKKVYEAFFDLLHDDDWVIRYNGIKALTNFGFDNMAFKDILKDLKKDIDIDVRELAIKVLGDLA